MNMKNKHKTCIRSARKKRKKIANPFYIITAIFLASIIIRLLFVDISYVFWDEGAYVGNAKFFAFGETNYSELAVRPPLIPLIISPLLFLHNEFLIRVLMVLINSTLAIAVYLLVKEMFETKAALIAAFLVAILPFHIIFSGYIMTDSVLALLIASLSFFCLKFSGNKERKYIFLIGLISGLVFLTKYTAVVIAPVILLPFLLMKKFGFKDALLLLTTFLAVILPHLMSQYFLFGNPLQFLPSAVSAVSNAEPVTLPLLGWWFLDLIGLIIVPLAIGIYMMVKEKDWIPLYFFFSLYLIYLVIVNQGTDKPPGILWLTERFLLPTLPFALVIASRALSTLSIRKIAAFMVATLIIFVPLYQRYSQPAIYLEDGKRAATREMAEYISANINPAETIYCNFNCPSLAYYIPQKVVWLPANLSAWDYVAYFGQPENIQEYTVVHSIEDKTQEVSLLMKN